MEPLGSRSSLRCRSSQTVLVDRRSCRSARQLPEVTIAGIASSLRRLYALAMVIPVHRRGRVTASAQHPSSRRSGWQASGARHQIFCQAAAKPPTNLSYFALLQSTRNISIRPSMASLRKPIRLSTSSSSMTFHRTGLQKSSETSLAKLGNPADIRFVRNAYNMVHPIPTRSSAWSKVPLSSLSPAETT